MSDQSVFHVSLDRIEEGIAVLMTRDGHTWLLPGELLPEGSSEGDVLRVTMGVDVEETGRLAGSIRDLQARLLRRTADRQSSDS